MDKWTEKINQKLCKCVRCGGIGGGVCIVDTGDTESADLKNDDDELDSNEKIFNKFKQQLCCNLPVDKQRRYLRGGGGGGIIIWLSFKNPLLLSLSSSSFLAINDD
ncbi:hypothetical protein DERP_007301 [Dermatophagoides pteronyssinus]|uniref:Uncharacterized protein n=1 Tax=Dermatophagoides pteronyssinus TaxID=6956 RepID=A0ABQ8J407_DERPT|nr:hypothetical protein DERP_007301 [Dermatophagoides pteronyssinus]